MLEGGSRNPSVVDVAAAAGVSLGTVSNVLNRPEQVSPATRAKVQAAMAQLGFVRNESARQLRAGESRVIGYVTLDVSNPFFTDVAQGIDRATADRNLSLFLCSSDNDARRETAYLRNLQQQRVHGIFLTPIDAYSPLLTEIARHTPLVIVDRTRDDDLFCSAAADDVAGGRLAVEHLIDRGHTRIAFIGGPNSIGQVRDRHQGAIEACRDAGLPEETLVAITTPGLTFADGRAAGEQLSGISPRRRPTAAFCANDLVALGLLQHVTHVGQRVPDDLAIVGFDDIEFAAAAAVPLTSVRQPRHSLGRAAAELLLDEAKNSAHQHQQIVFTPDLVARGSTQG